MTFASTFENVLSIKLSELYNKEVTVEYLHEVRGLIANMFLECLNESVYASSISVNGAQWLVNEIFKNIQLASDTKINDLIVTNDVELSEIDVNSLTSLREMFEGTRVYDALEVEHQRRLSCW
jgi:hypothetical protein